MSEQADVQSTKANSEVDFATFESALVDISKIVTEGSSEFPSGYFTSSQLRNAIETRLEQAQQGLLAFTEAECGSLTDLALSVGYAFDTEGDSWYQNTGLGPVDHVVDDYTLEDVLWGLYEFSVAANAYVQLDTSWVSEEDFSRAVVQKLSLYRPGVYYDISSSGPFNSLIKPDSTITLYSKLQISAQSLIMALLVALPKTAVNSSRATKECSAVVFALNTFIDKVLVRPAFKVLLNNRNGVAAAKIGTEVGKVQEAYNALSLECESLSNSNEELRRDKSDLESRIQGLQKQVAALQLQIDHGLTAVDLDAVLAQLQQVVGDLTKERQSLEQARNEITLVKGDLQDVVTRCAAFVSEKDTAISGAIEEVKSVLADYEGLDNHTQESITKIQESAEEAIGKFIDVSNDAGQLLEKLRALEVLIANLANNANGIQANMGNLSDIVSDLYVVSSNLHGLGASQHDQDQMAHLLAIGGVGAILGWLCGSRKGGSTAW